LFSAGSPVKTPPPKKPGIKEIAGHTNGGTDMKDYKKKWKVSVVILLFAAAVAFGQSLWAAPKLAPSKAKGGECAACHLKEKVLPESHPDTAAMDWAACKACHAEGAMVLTGKMPGSHRHQLSGVNCEKCHGKAAQQEALTMDQCVACHGSTDKLAEKTKNVKPTNPHTSPHYGTKLDCNLCHHQHAKTENYCNTCHDFKFVVP